MKKLLSAFVITGLVLGCQSGSSTSKPKSATPPAGGGGKVEDKAHDDKGKAADDKGKAPNAK